MRRFAVFIVLACLTLPANAQTVTAILEPANQVEIRSSVNGRLDQILVHEGQTVKEGAPLATIDARVQKARVELVRLAAESASALERSEVLVEQAQTLRNRMVRARSKGAAQKWEVLQAEQALQLAHADRVLATEKNAQAHGQLLLEEAILSEFTMNAPFNGTILQIFSDEGEIVDTQMTVIEIGNMASLEATAFAPLEWLDWLKPDGDVNVYVQGDEQALTGTVASIDPRIDPASQSVRVKLTIDNSMLGILAGTPVSISRP